MGVNWNRRTDTKSTKDNWFGDLITTIIDDKNRYEIVGIASAAQAA